MLREGFLIQLLIQEPEVEENAEEGESCPEENSPSVEEPTTHARGKCTIKRNVRR